ncbi:hypothetical protein HYC85_019622 [Camellia sinensis]|uniref:Uncharacterized protein n=1 Tax=Camellia sinensis TaxID=4442 RepID=A0A7J7GMP5_CAMSI|nr:hypothetical protein HYC85_019622 [Camellia sinensis]
MYKMMAAGSFNHHGTYTRTSDPLISLRDVKDNPVILYMKGVPDLSRCGFSSLAFTEFELTLLFTDLIALGYYGILTIDMPFADVPLSARNILEDPELKNAVKAYSNSKNCLRRHLNSIHFKWI